MHFVASSSPPPRPPRARALSGVPRGRFAYTVGFQLYRLLPPPRGKTLRVAARSRSNKTCGILVACVFRAPSPAPRSSAWIESAPDYLAASLHPAARTSRREAIVGPDCSADGSASNICQTKTPLSPVQPATCTSSPLALGIRPIAPHRMLPSLCLPEITPYGIHTSLIPWAVDFGDGPRTPHATLRIRLPCSPSAFAPQASAPAGPTSQTANCLRLFMLAYLTFRFVTESIKPRYTISVPSTSVRSRSPACSAPRGVLWQGSRFSPSDPSTGSIPSMAGRRRGMSDPAVRQWNREGRQR
jgi:hypothetical protein